MTPPAADVTDAMKHCTYCLRPHARRGRACSEHCERRTRSALGAKTAWHTRNRRKYMAKLQAANRHNRTWRSAAMHGTDDAAMLTIFGVDNATVGALLSEVRGGCALDIVA